MPTVTMPDGTAVDMPDDISPEMGARLRAFADSQKAAPTRPVLPQIGGVLGVHRQDKQPDAGARAIGAYNQFPVDVGGKVTDIASNMGAPPQVAAGAGVLGNMAGQAAETVGPGMVGRGLKAGGAVLDRVIPMIRGAAPELGFGNATSGLRSVVGDLTGSKAADATAKAQQATKQAATEGARAADQLASEDTQYGKFLEAEKKRVADQLEKARPRPADLDTQGAEIRKSYTDAIESAKGARAQAADAQFSSVKQLAAQREAQGLRVTTSGAEKILQQQIKESEGIPELQNAFNKMLSSVRGDGERKTFSQLELSRRYLNDIGNSSPLEGYSAIMRGTAKKVAQTLDDSMQKFLPEFKTYKDNYRKMSEPLDSLNTRLGRAVAGQEGGLQKDVYDAVPNANLPGRLFARREGVDLLTDALAGGKNATPEARGAAAAKVDQMVQHWILESSATKNAAGVSKRLADPQVRAMLQSAPNAAKTLTGKFADLSGMEATTQKLGQTSADIAKRGEAAATSAAKLKTTIQMADAQAAQPGRTAQATALGRYRSALDSARRDGLIPQSQYQATLTMINRAETLDEKMRLARKIAVGIAGASVVVGEGARYVGH